MFLPHCICFSCKQFVWGHICFFEKIKTNYTKIIKWRRQNICFSVYLFLPLQVSHGDEADLGGEEMRKERRCREAKLWGDAPDAWCTLTLQKLYTFCLFTLTWFGCLYLCVFVLYILEHESVAYASHMWKSHRAIQSRGSQNIIMFCQ